MEKIMGYIALKGIRHWILVGLLLLGAIEGGMITAKYSENITDLVNRSILHKEVLPTSIPTPTDAPFIDCYVNGELMRVTQMTCLDLNRNQTQPTKKAVRITQDPDPIIDCKFTYIGTLRLKRSVCSASTDCQINGKWYYYDSVEKCRSDQNKYRNNPNYVYSTYAPLPTWKPFATYAPYPTSIPFPTYSNPVYVPQQTKAQCQSDVNDKYRSQMVNLGCYYPCPDTGDCGSTGTCAFLWSQAQKEMSSCNQYP